MAETGGDVKKYPYPKSIPFILTTEFCERFSYYGMRAILTLFVNQVIGFSETDSSVLFHGFTVLAYFSPIFGAILADSFIGKYKTIFYVSIIYGIGQVVMTLGSVGDTEDGKEGISGLPTTALVLTGLFLVGIGTGGIKPCVATFGGEQFKLPEQAKECALFFSIFYWAVNLGSFLSMIVTPQLRANVSCLGQEYCYPLAFGVPAVLMFAAIGAFLVGRVFNMYKMILPDKTQENIMKKTTRCIWRGLTGKKVDGQTHWLEKGKEEFGEKFIADTKAVLNVTFMMLTFPIFWALFDQQGSRWTFQATRMDGTLFSGFTLQPDNMQVANAILILVMVPVFNISVYPLLAKCNLLTTSLQRIGVGFVLAALSFGISGLIELKLETTYPHVPGTGMGQITAYNMLPTELQNCDLSFQLDGNPTYPTIKKGDIFSNKLDIKTGTYNVSSISLCNIAYGDDLGEIEIKEGISSSVVFYTEYPRGLHMRQTEFNNEIEKPDGGTPSLRVIWSDLEKMVESSDITGNVSLVLRKSNAPTNEELWNIFDLGVVDNMFTGETEAEQVGKFGKYQVYLNNISLGMEVNLEQGGNYNLVLVGAANTTVLQEVTPANSFSMIWQLPQYVIMTAAEVLFSISSMEFCFSQAPVEMKAVMLAMRYLTNAFGNLIDIFVMKVFEGLLPSQAYEFFLFAGLTLVMAALFVWCSLSYKYVDYTSGNGESIDIDTVDESEEKPADTKEKPQE